jgi:hypothetical protein
MDSQDQRAAVRKLTTILRKITRYVQWIPFVYLAVYSLMAFSETQMTEELLCFRDSVLAVSPAVNVGFLFFNRLLELCRWHRIACIIPLGSNVTGYIDCYLFQFTQSEIVFLNLLFGVISFVFLLLANSHFFGNGRKRTHTANA